MPWFSALSGEAGKDCIPLPASVWLDPGQHAQVLPERPLSHLLHIK